MNPRQKSYDSYDKTNKLLKLTNSYYHFRNLEIIKNRRSQYNNAPLYFHSQTKTRNVSKRKKAELFQTYFLKKGQGRCHGPVLLNLTDQYLLPLRPL